MQFMNDLHISLTKLTSNKLLLLVTKSCDLKTHYVPIIFYLTKWKNTNH